MAIRICPSCGGKVSTTRTTCSHCGYDFESKKVCPECEESIEINATECPVCGYCFDEQENSTADTPAVETSLPEAVVEEPGYDYVQETYADKKILTIKSQLTKEQFFRNALMELCRKTSVPTDVFTAKMGEVKDSTVEVYAFVGDVEGDYSGSIGYDRKEQYLEEKVQYRQGNKYTTLVPAIRTVTDWQPYNAYLKKTREKTSICETDGLLTGNGNIKKIAEEYLCDHQLDYIPKPRETFPIVTGELCERAKELLKFKARRGINWPGDHRKDEIYNLDTEISKIYLIQVPCYEMAFEYDGKTYTVKGLAVAGESKLDIEYVKPSKNAIDLQKIKDDHAQKRHAQDEKFLKDKTRLKKRRKLSIILAVICGVLAGMFLQFMFSGEALGYVGLAGLLGMLLFIANIVLLNGSMKKLEAKSDAEFTLLHKELSLIEKQITDKKIVELDKYLSANNLPALSKAEKLSIDKDFEAYTGDVSIELPHEIANETSTPGGETGTETQEDLECAVPNEKIEIKPKAGKKNKPVSNKNKQRVIGIACAAVLAVGCGVGLYFALRHEHHFTSEVIAPTCEAEGYTKHVCDCGTSYTDTFVISTGHIYVDGTCTGCSGTAVRYALSGDSYIVEGIISEADAGNLVILSEYNGLPVTAIGNYAFNYCGSLTSVTIPDSVTSIGEGAFNACTNLESVTIPDSVTSIGKQAFHNCYSLTSLTIPDSVTSIGENAFSFCDGLTNLTCPAWVDISQIAKSSLQTVVITSGDRISEGAFSGCSNLTSITLPDSITSIDAYAFINCSSLTSITIPENVTSIGKEAFYNCTGLTEIYFNAINCADFDYWNYVFYAAGHSGAGVKVAFGENVKRIPAYLFYTATTLAYAKIISVTMGNSVESIGASAFYDCNELTSINISDSVKSIGNYAFKNCYSLTSIELPDGLESIGNYAFEYCALTEIVIPDSVTSLGSLVFYYCEKLESVVIGDGITSVGSFYGCIALASVVIGDGATSIEACAFRYCENLTSVVIGKNVTSIEESVFEYCIKLTEIVIPESVTSIGNHAFYACDDLTIYCEATSKPSGWSEYWNSSDRPVVWDYEAQ